MNEEQIALLLNIVDQSDDPIPRLVYADWLEENGQSERAAFIRLQCELRTTSPSDPNFANLLQQEMDTAFREEEAFRAQLPRLSGLIWGPFERGFVERLIVRGQVGITSFAEHFPELIGLTPWRELCLTELDRNHDLRDWQTLPVSPCLRSIHVGPGWGERAFAPLFRSLLMSTVHRLVIDEVWIDEVSQRALVETPHVRALMELVLTRTGFQGGLLRRLTSEQLPRLHTLSMRSNRLTSDGVRELVRGGIVQQLRSLDLCENQLNSSDLATLSSGEPSRLESLSLAQNNLTGAGIEGLSVAVPSLKSLDLRKTEMTGSALARLAASPLAEQLTHLDLSNNELSDDDLVYFFHSDWPRLQRLNLSQNQLTTLSVTRLAEFGGLAQLVQLDIGRNLIGEEGVASIVRSPHRATLNALLIYGTILSPRLRKEFQMRFRA